MRALFSGSRTQVYAYSDQHSYAPLARIDGTGIESKIYYFHNQVNGQPEAMTDSEGKECWRGEPDSWGKIKGETHPREITTGGPQNLRMQGQYLDRETGLHYNLYRYYDPDNGRFTQQDPIGLLGGLNLYQYAPNALGWVDPLGLLKCGLTGNEVGNASNLKVIKPGTHEWKQAVEAIRGGKNSNFRTATEKDAIDLVNQGRGRIQRQGEIGDPYNENGGPYKKGYEIHPNEAHTQNAPENNTPHVKWKDWEAGKSNGGRGHVFF